MRTEHPENLAAWLDDELAHHEAEAVSRHVERCGECRERAQRYVEVGLWAAETPAVARRRWMPVAAAVAGIAAALVVAVAQWPAEQRMAIQLPKAPGVVEVASVARVAAVPAVRKPGRPVRVPEAPAAPEPLMASFRIALPADDLFPPGALPPGYAVMAEVAVDAGGAPQALRLLP